MFVVGRYWIIARDQADGSGGSAREMCAEAKHSAERSPWHCCKNKRIANGVYPPRPRGLRFIYDTTEPSIGVASLPAATSSIGDLAPGLSSLPPLSRASFLIRCRIFVILASKILFSLSPLSLLSSRLRVNCVTRENVYFPLDPRFYGPLTSLFRRTVSRRLM